MKTVQQGELKAAESLPQVLDRPIETAAEDKLERSGFIRRLADAVIARGTNAATGVIIGITGPWGSGKSSILNLLATHILEIKPETIVVRFDPWLISGRNDLIGEFIAELIAQLQQKAGRKKRFKTAVEKLVEYGQMITPLATVVPYGIAVKGALELAKDHLGRQKSVHEQRRELMAALTQVNSPIVVLIDELDRIEDEEIRIVAQLVRSVADFPGISYVLAYDAERVIRALAGADKVERGRAYLEKIVQLQIPLPILLDDELYRLIEADLDSLGAEGLIPGDRSSIERYRGLRQLLVPRLVATPRDVKRLTGAFGTLVRMLGAEVDWIDLLGFCALLVKAPLTAEQIKQDPDLVVDDPTSMDEITARISEERTTPEGLFDRVNPDREGGATLRRLLAFLFPRLSDDRADRRYDRRQGTSICKMQPLLTTLRLDLVPGYFPREAVLDLFKRPAADVTAFLRANYDANRIDKFLVKLQDTAEELATIPQQAFWHGVAVFLQKPDAEFLRVASPMHEIVRGFAIAFFATTGVEARALFLGLLAHDEVELTAALLRSHVFHYGLFGHTSSDRGVVFLERQEAEQIARDTALKHREQHLNGRFLWTLWDANPVYTMVGSGAWDDACRRRLEEFLEDPRAVDALTMLFFGDTYGTGRDFLSKLIDLDGYLVAVDRRLAAGDMHESVRLALEKAKHPMFG
jgi:ABC-type transport system involved in cytochrome c biogenesis ATPase subunit